MAILALDMSAPFLARHQIAFHLIVKKHIEIVCLHIGFKENLKIIVSTIGTVAVFKK
jgi:hypothetical protein